MALDDELFDGATVGFKYKVLCAHAMCHCPKVVGRALAIEDGRRHAAGMLRPHHRMGDAMQEHYLKERADRPAKEAAEEAQRAAFEKEHGVKLPDDPNHVTPIDKAPPAQGTTEVAVRYWWTS